MTATGTITVTFFPDEKAQKKREEALTLEQLRDKILSTTAADKFDLPLLKLAAFGNQRTDKNCLRSNANCDTIYGCEVEHDLANISFEEAVAVLKAANLRALIYTSPSYKPEKPKWRALLPTSRPIPSDHQNKPFVARVNGIFAGQLSGESFTLSQTFFFGSVNGNPNHQAVITDGDYIDLRTDLDAGAMNKEGTAQGERVPDEKYIEDIRSGAVYHTSLVILAARHASQGLDADTISKTLEDLMDQSRGDRDRRWRGAVNDVQQIVASAVAKYTPQTAARRRQEQIAENIKIGDDVTEPIFPTILTLAEMKNRLVFVGDSAAVIDRVAGIIRKKDIALTEWAASKHTYTDSNGNRKRVGALKLWLEADDRVTVDELAWIPGELEICRGLERPCRAFNTWRGVGATMPAPEDWETRVSAFIEHIEYLVPVESERGRFLDWLAHIIQQPQELPHTAYLMVAENTGIGRNLLASMLVRALRGHVASGVAMAQLLDGGFNGRISQKLLATVDEVKEGGGEDTYRRAQTLKRLITEEHRRINHKYGLQITEKNCCRWLMFSNHYDALPFDKFDRRIIVIKNPTERKEPSYYEEKYNLLDDPLFIASVRKFLETRNISKFKVGELAPLNEAKQTALREMTGEVDRMVEDFKEDCKTNLVYRSMIKQYVSGFEGHVSDKYLGYAIKRSGMIVTERRVKAYLSNNNPKRETIVIVREWTPERVVRAEEEDLIKVVTPAPPKT